MQEGMAINSINNYTVTKTQYICSFKRKTM